MKDSGLWLMLAIIFLLALFGCSAENNLEDAEQELRFLEYENKQLREEIADLKEQLEVLEEREEAREERLSTLDCKEDVVRVVMAEARGESLAGQMAVAQTILDRSTEWGKSSSEIINAKSQYASPYEGEIDDLSELAVDLIYSHGYRVFEEPTTHFYAPDKVEPKWAEAKEERGVIGAHRFMY